MIYLNTFSNNVSSQIKQAGSAFASLASSTATKSTAAAKATFTAISQRAHASASFVNNHKLAVSAAVLTTIVAAGSAYYFQQDIANLCGLGQAPKAPAQPKATPTPSAPAQPKATPAPKASTQPKATPAPEASAQTKAPRITKEEAESYRRKGNLMACAASVGLLAATPPGIALHTAAAPVAFFTDIIAIGTCYSTGAFEDAVSVASTPFKH